MSQQLSSPTSGSMNVTVTLSPKSPRPIGCSHWHVLTGNPDGGLGSPAGLAHHGRLPGRRPSSAQAQHLCMATRGVEKQHSTIKTSVMLGRFRDSPPTRSEFLQLVGNG